MRATRKHLIQSLAGETGGVSAAGWCCHRAPRLEVRRQVSQQRAGVAIARRIDEGDRREEDRRGGSARSIGEEDR